MQFKKVTALLILPPYSFSIFKMLNEISLNFRKSKRQTLRLPDFVYSIRYDKYICIRASPPHDHRLLIKFWLKNPLNESDNQNRRKLYGYSYGLRNNERNFHFTFLLFLNFEVWVCHHPHLDARHNMHTWEYVKWKMSERENLLFIQIRIKLCNKIFISE